MYPVSVKSEINFCNCCLTTDRNLEPLGKYCDVFQKIMQGKSSLVQNMNLAAVCICWECSSLLKKVLQFQAKTENAQVVLQLAETQNMIYPPLTTLDAIVITEKSHKYLTYEEAKKIEIKLDLSNKVKIDDAQEDYNNDLDDEPLKDVKPLLGTDLLPDDDDAFDDFDIRIDNTELNDEQVLDDMQTLDDIKKEMDMKKLIKKQTKADRKATAANKFKKIIVRAFKHKVVSVNHEQMLALMEKEKQGRGFKKNKFKCNNCIISYKTEADFMAHNNKYHKNSCGKHICEICQCRFTSIFLLKVHTASHYSKYFCVMCNETFYRRYNYHKHNMKYHRQIYECKECGKRYWRRREFYEHYKEMHSLFQCDYCGRSFNIKETLIKHIGRRHVNEGSKTCEVCKKTFSSVRNLRTHYKMYHTRSEAYCVECDLVLPNIDLYKRHLRSSVKHRPRKKQSFPCPDCGKIYARRCSMNYHYTYVHKQETKFKCELCDRYFLNGFRLRTHKKTKHDKIPPEKNKMCTICGRSFSTNRILENHIRTHTGERPHSCPHCPAAFAQRTAMRVHIRNIHLRSQT